MKLNISINNFVYFCHIVVINVRSDPPNKCKRPHEVCINKNSGFECRCGDGYERNSGSCIEKNS